MGADRYASLWVLSLGYLAILDGVTLGKIMRAITPGPLDLATSQTLHSLTPLSSTSWKASNFPPPEKKK